MEKILIADDDREIAALISDALSDEGLETLVVYDGESALEAVARNSEFSLVMLDIMMPGTDGLEVCRKIRETVSCPIVFVTAKNRLLDTMLGLEMGGDDYIAKPFVVDELVARVRAHLRREKRNTRTHARVLRVNGLEIHKDSYEAYLDGTQLDLSTREFQLLCYLCENEGRVLSREQIFSAVWGPDYGDIGTVAVNIKNLRDKFDRANRYIKTVWGVGYKLVKPTGGDRSEHYC